MDFKVEAHWTSRLESVLEAVGENAQEVLEDMAIAAVEEARERVRVKTGETRMNITLGKQRKARGRTRRAKGMMDVQGGVVSAPFPAAHLEFGTKRMRAFPFMVPSVMAQKRKALMRIAAEGLV